MIDANLNRAREAARVLEDLARFVLSDAELQARAKRLRHELVERVREAALDGALLLAARDVAGDPGTGVSTPTEMRRESASDLAAANAARLSEALRAIEEAAKALPAQGLAAGVERLRYESYDLDRALRLRLPTGRAPQWRLCVLITESLCTRHSWQRVAALAIEGGAECLQLREKSLEDGELLARARWLVGLAGSKGVHRGGCGERGREEGKQQAVSVIVNDRPDIALLAGAAGVHVGQRDLSVEDVRRVAGHRLLVGVSCGSVEQSRRAAAAGADYLGLGPMFESTTKPKPSLPGPSLLQSVAGDPIAGTLPHLAISGITPENVDELVKAGVRGVAVSSAVCSSDDPAGACRAILARLPRG